MREHRSASWVPEALALLVALAVPSRAQCPQWETAIATGGGMDSWVMSLARFDDGSGPAIYAGGRFTNVAGSSITRIARWNGTAWSGFGGGGANGDVLTLAVFDDGSGPALYAGGLFTTIGGLPFPYLVRWNGTSWSTVGGGVNGGISALEVLDDGTGPALYVGGYFTQVGTTPANHIARWNGTAWSALGSGVDGSVLALAVYDDGAGPALYIAGAFPNAGGSLAHSIARWNGSSWSALLTGITGAGQINDMCVFDDGSGPGLYLVGTFDVVSGVPASRIARWNGSSFSALGSGLDDIGYSLAVFDDGSGPALCVAGNFFLSGGTPHGMVARWDGASWSSFPPGPGGGGVKELAVIDDGGGGGPALYTGGNFTSVGGVSCKRITVLRGCAGPGTASCAGDGASPVPCPCGNTGATGRGCDNSAGTGGARLVLSGTPSPDTIVMHGSDALASSPGIYLQGDLALGNAVPFGDGLRCVGGVLLRLYLKFASSGASFAPDVGAGDPSISSRAAALGFPIQPGTTRTYQLYYRDTDAAFCPAPAGNTWNVSSAQSLVW